ncbi:hypothetical protein ABPG75_010513 [Micractinium tetrahymenae]
MSDPAAVNWRQDTWSDLQLFAVINSAVFLAGAAVQALLLRGVDESVPPPPEGAGLLHQMWYSLYSVLAVVLGQDLPPGQAGWPSQLFAVVIAIFGLASFALVLALTEQFVLEILERNVQRGSQCYEGGHTVVLAWCESSRDIAQLTRILTQLCAANRGSGGGAVVRGKLQMEQLFREVVPESQRLGTKFVFRQGSPMDPSMLCMVGVADAQRIIICSDYRQGCDRTAMEADAQVLRVSVLLDEMLGRERPGQAAPVVVAQVKTDDAMPLLNFVNRGRIIPVPTNRVNARRYVRLLRSPIATVFSRYLTDFYSVAHAFIDRLPEVEGRAFGELFRYFPDAIVVGLQNLGQGYCQLNPPPEQRVAPGDDVITLRPGKHGAGPYHALAEPIAVGPGEGWDPRRYVMTSLDEQPLGPEPSEAYLASSARPGAASQPVALPPAGTTGSQPEGSLSPKRRAMVDKGSRQGLYVLPVQYHHPLVQADKLLICGWMSQTFMWSLLAELDHSDQGLPAGSRVTLLNSHPWTQAHLGARCEQYGIKNLQLQHVRGDPRSRSEMTRLIDVRRFKAAIVVCDSTWAGCGAPDREGGPQLLTQAEMLSLDAAVLMVQLNIRLLLEEARQPSIPIICEKLTYLGGTRFEDDTKPPAGIVINSSSYAAKALTKVAVEPRFFPAYMQLGVESDVTVQDASAFAAEGEELSFAQLQARAASVRQALLLRGVDESVPPPPEGAGLLHQMWYSLYSVLAVVLGQDLPPGQAGWPSQLFAVVIAIFGLASFALVLALTEQFVLEILERNVQRGSQCYEGGHTVVLAWCESSRDIAQLTRILTQLCAANRGSGGGAVVVLTQQRGKLQMEQLFREVVPESQRLGTKFVFRQGSPMDPSMLCMVGVADAQRIIICSDYSRTAMEADAQVLRVSVLLDEMLGRERPGQAAPVVVAQVKTDDAMPLLNFVNRGRIIPVPTNRVNARRYVRLLRSPIATVFSRYLTDFYSVAHAFIDRLPEVEGRAFGELFRYFPDAIVVGLQNLGQGYCQLNPPPEQRVAPGDDVITLRPGKHGAGPYHALAEPIAVGPGEGWDPRRYVMTSLDEQPLGPEPSEAYLASSARPGAASQPVALPPAGTTGSQPEGSLSPKRRAMVDKGSRQGLYVLPVQYHHPLVQADKLLICGWMSQTFMWSLLAELDHSDQGLPAGSRVTLLNSHPWTQAHLGARCEQYGIKNLQLQHVRGDPRSRSEMTRLIDVRRFKAAIVVCDSTWAGCGAPDREGGPQLLTQAEMLSLDAAVLMVQLNIRLLLEEARQPSIPIICEKLTYLGGTRFEDDTKPPAGIVINSSSYAAKALTKVAVEPRFFPAYMQLGVESDVTVQDASAFAAEGEELSFAQLQARAASVRQALLLRGVDESVPPPPEGAGLLHQMWYSLYSVLAVVLGQDLPPGQAGWPSQLFAVVIAIFGLASFALVLALTEQFVLEILERNVQRGSQCYEGGHTVVLAWCESSRDIAQLTRILTQLCAANRGSGGGAVVVLTQQRGKLQMEQLFREVVPESQRLGTKFVFRQGSPMDPSMLCMVGVADAQRIIICSDYSRTAMEADAQVLRVSVLLDEMLGRERPGQAAPVVVAQVKTDDAMPLLNFVNRGRIIPVPTNRVNARRYVRLLRSPIATVFSRYLTDFYSVAHAFIDRLPEVEGRAFGELFRYFPDAIVVGVANEKQRTHQLNPPPETAVGPDDEIITLRPESVPPGEYRVLAEAMPADLGNWNPNKYTLRSQDEQPMGVDVFDSTDSCLAQSARAYAAAMASPPQRPPVPDEPSLLGLWAAGLSQQSQTETFQDSLQGLYVLPLQYSQNLTPDDQLLICGWALPAGSRVTLFNDHNWTPELLESRCKEYGIRNLCVCHVRGDPRSRSEMQKLIDVTQFKGAFVVCDSLWASDDAGQPSADGGLRLLSQAEMLSLDAAMLMVQLNIRLALEEARHPHISIICEKLTYVGVTRFEDDARLPLGIAINSASFAAKALTQVAVNPRFLYAYLTLGMESDDASAFAGEGEELSFAQLQARAASVRQGLEERLQLRVWNTGDHRCKLVTMAKKKEIRASRERGGLSSWFGSVDASDGSGDANRDVLCAAGSSQEPAAADSSSSGSGAEVEGPAGKGVQQQDWVAAARHAAPAAEEKLQGPMPRQDR